MRFHIYLNWLMTEEDARSYYEAKSNGVSTLWKPSWHPQLEFENASIEVTKHFEMYPQDGRFRRVKMKDFGKNRKEKIDEHLFDCEHAAFIRAKLECEMTFIQPMRLKNFPFDVCKIYIIIT